MASIATPWEEDVEAARCWSSCDGPEDSKSHVSTEVEDADDLLSPAN